MSVDKIVRFGSHKAYLDVLKICNENNLSVKTEDDLAVLVISEKDEWESVEYVHTPKGIFPIKEILRESIVVTHKNKYDSYRRFLLEKCNPSTRIAYVEQLKNEAIERFGSINITTDLDFSEMKGGSISLRTEAVYRKDTDTLYLVGEPVYQAGKWAKLKPKRIEVSFESSKCRDNPVLPEHDFHTYKFHVSSKNGLPWGAEKFLAKQYEKYLNGEIGKEESHD